MKLQYILRVEHPVTKMGPFTFNDETPKELMEVLFKIKAWGGFYKFPPITRTPGFEPETHICGVEYKSQLADWMGPFWETLHNAGYLLCVYTLPSERILRCVSGSQVAFMRSDVVETFTVPML
jgi:hypothetical protein